MSATAMLAVGDVLARKYKLEERLGEGGMAEVWVAHNMALDVRVAVKIMRAELTRDPKAVARFRREAKITASFHHKNIVQVFDFGITAQGAPFLVMELLVGETLAQRLEAQRTLQPTEAVRVVLLALKGITIAHAKGIVHRDLKPENVFLAREEGGTERPKILDFGISSFSRGGTDQTTRSTPMGTPAYLPPEAIREDRRGDAKGDVWALGLILYESIRGKLPWRTTSTHELLESICRDDVPSLCDVPGVDAELDAIVHRALAKTPDDRFPGARELFDALNTWLGAREEAVLLAASVPRMRQAVSADPNIDDSPTAIGPSLPAGPPSEGGVASSQHKLKIPRKGSRALWIGAAGTAIALGAAAFLLVARGGPPHRSAGGDTSAHVPAAPSSAPAASPSAEMILRIENLPEEAKVYVNEARIDLPFRMKPGESVHVRVEAEGRLPWEHIVSAEGSVRLVYNGAPKPRPSPRPTGGYKDVPY